MKPLLIHGGWALLAAGAYFAGALGRNPGSQADAINRTAAGGAAAARDSAGEHGSRNAAAITSAASAESQWLAAFRSSDGTISADRMKEAVQSALRETDPVKSTLGVALLLKELTPENAPAALQAVNENASGREASRFLSLLAHAWGSKDGSGALAALSGLQGRESDVAKSTAMAAWAATDPDAAMNWLQERKAAKDSSADPRQDTALARGMISGLAQRDVDGALKYLMTLNEGQQGDFVGLLVEQKMKEGIGTGAEWAESLPNERMRVNGMEIAGGQYVRRDLDGAVKWAEKIAGRADAHEAVADIANEMAGKNPQQAAAWVAKLPPGPSQNHAFEDVFETWTHTDPLAASQSLTAMTAGPGRDTAIQAFAGTLARENPADALTWAAVISDSKQRTELQVDIARRWYGSSPNDAQAWIAANLPADLQPRAMTPQKR